jgi:hypothetical protein
VKLATPAGNSITPPDPLDVRTKVTSDVDPGATTPHAANPQLNHAGLQTQASSTTGAPSSDSSSDGTVNKSSLLAQLSPDPVPVAARQLSGPDPGNPARTGQGTNENGASLLASLITAPPASRSSQGWFVWLGAGLLLLALGLAAVVWRSSRRANKTSFITQSMYRK